MLNPIKLYSHAGVGVPILPTFNPRLIQLIQGPNPPKVAIILEELGVPYETQLMDFLDMKKEPFTSVNPNGRVPAIEDPNTGITLWESSAIIDYLLETYDKSNSLQYTSGPESFLQKSWMAFQISGQGPYYGQRAWFLFVGPFHIHQITIGGIADCPFFSTIRKKTSNLPSTATATSMWALSSLVHSEKLTHLQGPSRHRCHRQPP